MAFGTSIGLGLEWGRFRLAVASRSKRPLQAMLVLMRGILP